MLTSIVMMIIISTTPTGETTKRVPLHDLSLSECKELGREKVRDAKENPYLDVQTICYVIDIDTETMYP